MILYLLPWSSSPRLPLIESCTSLCCPLYTWQRRRASGTGRPSPSCQEDDARSGTGVHLWVTRWPSLITVLHHHHHHHRHLIWNHSCALSSPTAAGHEAVQLIRTQAVDVTWEASSPQCVRRWGLGHRLDHFLWTGHRGGALLPHLVWETHLDQSPVRIYSTFIYDQMNRPIKTKSPDLWVGQLQP